MIKLEEDDFVDIMDMKWDGFMGMLEIYFKYEGEVWVIVILEDVKEKKVIYVKVRLEGKLEILGWYSINLSLYYLI